MSIKSWLALKLYSRARDARIRTNTSASHSIVIPEATYSPWIDDREFAAVFEKVRGNSMVDVYRAHELWALVEQTAHLRGDILEVGVWRGGTGCLLAARAAKLHPAARVFLCDTFKGVVKAGAQDSEYRGGEHADTSIETVRQLASMLELTNVELLEGIFPDVTGGTIEGRRFSLCHIDVDVYESARHVADWVWPRLEPGGVLIYDDYGFSSCEGVTQLINERQQGHSAITLHNLNGHAVVVKLR